MAKRKRTRYSPEFKAEAVELVRRGGRSVAELAAELSVSEQSLYRWVERARIDEKADPEGPLTSSERTELSALRRRLKEVEQERDFLKKTAAYFASAKK
jgi:transposase